MQTTNPKRILIFSLAYYPKFVGGAEVAIKEITDRISPDEIGFDMVTAKLAPGQSSFEKIGNVNVYRIGVGSVVDKLLFPILGTFKTLKLHSQKKYDSLWAMMLSYSSGSAYITNILRGLAGKKKIPIILTLQEGDSEKHIKLRHAGLIGLSWKLALKRTAHLTVISNYLEGRARAYGYTGGVTLVPNAADVKLFSTHASVDQENALKEKLGKKEGDVFLITTSRLVEKNAVEDVIDALVYLPENVRFLILGEGGLRKKLEQKVETLNLKNRVQFLGYVSHAEMPLYLHVSDVFVRPALSEGFGLSFVEAMAAGIPVIATPVGGIVDFLKDGETGLFAEVKNPKNIAQKVEKLLKDRESRDMIIANAFAMVKEKYDWSKIAGEMKKVLQSDILS
ncbi:MAG: glycosyltransferase family 4 protein [Patescibacteria group bacterium]